MGGKRKSMRMRGKILALCLGISLSALILQTVLYLRTSSTLIYREAKEENLRLMENMQNEIESYARSIENGLLRLYNQSGFISDLRKGVSVETLREKWNRLAYNIGNENFDTSLSVLALYLYTADHEIISTYRKAMTPKHTYPADIYDETQDTNAQKVKDYVASDDSIMLVSSYYNVYRQKDIARFAVKLYHNRQVIGYAVCDTDEKALRYLMKKYTEGGEGYVWIQPLGDRAITATGELSETQQANFESASSEIMAESAEEEAITERENQVFFRVQQDKYNIGSYALMPQSLLEKNQRTLTRYLLMIGIAMSAAAVLFSYPISRGLTRQLEKMTETMVRIKGGETQLRMTNLPEDEIGQLGRTFNEMLDRIEGLIAREYEAKLMVNRAEYKALQAQINPHFLYNTLDTMSSIAELSDCPEVGALSQSLSNIFRYSLDMKNPFSTVAREIAHLKNYIYVMNVRMQGTVAYVFDVEEDILQDTLPRISIQPLVENALTHGLKNARGEKRVTVRAHKWEENLRIVVEDNGVGIRPQRMEELLQPHTEQETSIGLSNIDSRMKMLYGEAYGVTLESEEGKGTRVYLVIPRRKMDEVELWKAENTRC